MLKKTQKKARNEEKRNEKQKEWTKNNNKMIELNPTFQ